ncbi:protein kinase [Actinoplanes sp. NPDC049265]|uniref:protein kinase domain-containing protein n=1 Tax=Actinoplanes sp. NPDC049265 TaxID=3363902 RepID=UPI0037158FB8
MGRIGRRIADRYRLVEKLGTGGMSEVWRGYDETLGRDVAVKVLSSRLASDDAFRTRLRQEALAAARLCHPHITSIFDFGEAPLPFVVMELNEGESIAARVRRSGPMAWRDAVTLAAEIASALATAHAAGVVHRDITPANVMLTRAGAKVVDFGISALVGQRDAAPDGTLLGTPAYLAPERLGGVHVSPAADVYALGVLLYRMLTGRLPWPAENTTEALRAHLYADPEPMPSLPGLPPGVADLCLRCLAKSPGERPQAAEVADRLGALVGMQPIVPPISDEPTAALSREPRPARSGSGWSIRARKGASVAARDGASGRTREGVSVSAPDGASARTRDDVSVFARDDVSVFARDGASARTRDGVPVFARTGASARTGDGVSAFTRGGVPTGPLGDVTTKVAMRPSAVETVCARLGIRPPRPVKSLRLRAALRVLGALHVGVAKPLGGGLFRGGQVRHDLFSGRLRLQAGAATVVLTAVAGLSWSAAREPAEVGTAQASAAGAGTAGGVVHVADCTVRYRVEKDTGSDFEARLTVVNTGGQAVGGWRMEFAYPGSQRLKDPAQAVTQSGRRIVVHGRRNLGPGRSVSVVLRGAYRGSNPLPLAFTLDGRTCEAEVVGARTIEAEVAPEPAPTTQPARTVKRTPKATKHPKRPAPSRKSTPEPVKPKISKTPVRPAPPPTRTGGFSVAI